MLVNMKASLLNYFDNFKNEILGNSSRINRLVKYTNAIYSSSSECIARPYLRFILKCKILIFLFCSGYVNVIKKIVVAGRRTMLSGAVFPAAFRG